jgi:hypothetical protein
MPPSPLPPVSACVAAHPPRPPEIINAPRAAAARPHLLLLPEELLDPLEREPELRDVLEPELGDELRERFALAIGGLGEAL